MKSSYRHHGCHWLDRLHGCHGCHWYDCIVDNNTGANAVIVQNVQISTEPAAQTCQCTFINQGSETNIGVRAFAICMSLVLPPG